jgi:glycosyltransferase involved in cell wall biosynthesis
MTAIDLQLDPADLGQAEDDLASPMRTVDLSIVMPVYNEEQALPLVLEEAKEALADVPFTFEIVFADDASQDNSLRILSEFQQQNTRLGVRILRQELNCGIASTCNRLFGAARGRYVFLNASDGQCKTAECVAMMKLREQFDIVVGKRRSKHYSMSRAVISYAFNLLPRVLFGVQTGDAGSIKLYKAAALQIPLVSRGPFREAERLIRAERLGYRIGFVPVDNRPRQGGKPTGAHLRLVVQAISDLVRCWWDMVICRRV